VKRHVSILLPVLFLILFSCASRSPLDRLKAQLAKYPEYSVMLEDMKEEGNFFKDYFHRYKIVYGTPVENSDSLVYENYLTDWEKVSKKEYQKYWNYLGMVILSKTKDGGVTQTAYPPGYQYVGNPRYGHWRQDSHGSSFWEFYGKFAFFNAMFNMFGRPVYRNDWDTFSRYRSNRQPYFGRNRQYGTAGKYTQRTNKSFFQRRQQREAARKAKFSDRVKRRVKRSRMSGVRSRSGGFGK